MTSGYSNEWVSGPLMSTEQIGEGIGSYTLCLYWKPWEDGRIGSVDFELFEVVGLDGVNVTDGPLYRRRDSDVSPNFVTKLGEAESAAEGFVKWDGCTQFVVGDVHVDHVRQLQDLHAAIEHARRRCAEVMPWGDIAKEYR